MQTSCGPDRAGTQNTGNVADYFARVVHAALPFCIKGHGMKLRKTAIGDGIRWMLRRDMDEVLRIDQSHVWERWSDGEYLTVLRQSNVIGTVIEENGEVVAFMVYTLDRDSFTVLKMAVRQDMQRQCLGAMMVSRLIDKLTQQKRSRIIADVPEWMLDAQLFFQAMGFRGESIRDHIRFVYELEG